MKRQTNVFLFLLLFLLAIILTAAGNTENNNVLGCRVVTPDKINKLIGTKQPAAIPDDLLLYQNQNLPYIEESNTFFIPHHAMSEEWQGVLSSEGYGTVLIEKNDSLSSINTAVAESLQFHVYIINDSSYFETFVAFTASTILTFQTESFEHGNAYGTMNCYNPYDTEINKYSFKTSDAKLSYEIQDSITPIADRCYELKLRKNNQPNKMSLCGLRKDDDWELVSQLDNPEQIQRFYENWNTFCENENEAGYTIYFSEVDFYLDGQFQGKYLLKVPMDEKQLGTSVNTIFSEKLRWKNASYGKEISNILKETFDDSSLLLECYMLKESDGSSPTAIPKSFYRIPFNKPKTE